MGEPLPNILPQISQERDQRLQEFRRQVEAGFDDFIDNLEVFGNTPLSPDPSMMIEGEDRSMEDLSPDEQMEVRDVVYKNLGLDTLEDIEERKYESEAPPEVNVPGKIKVTVLRTNRPGVYMHEMVFSDGALRWAIGPNTDI